MKSIFIFLSILFGLLLVQCVQGSSDLDETGDNLEVSLESQVVENEGDTFQEEADPEPENSGGEGSEEGAEDPPTTGNANDKFIEIHTSKPHLSKKCVDSGVVFILKGSNDTSGKVLLALADPNDENKKITSCHLYFGQAYSMSPVCVVSSEGEAVRISTTNQFLKISKQGGGNMGINKVHYFCLNPMGDGINLINQPIIEIKN